MKKIFFMLVSFCLAAGFCDGVSNVEAASPKKTKQRMKIVRSSPSSKNKSKKTVKKNQKIGKKVQKVQEKKSKKVFVKKKNVLQKQGKKQVVAQRVSSIGRGLPLSKNHDAPATLPPVPPKL